MWGEMYDSRSKLQQLAGIIKKSNLSGAAQDDLLTLFSGAGHADLERMVKFLSQNPEWVVKLSEGCARKRAALKSGKRVSWEKVLAEEEHHLNFLK